MALNIPKPQDLRKEGQEITDKLVEKIYNHFCKTINRSVPEKKAQFYLDGSIEILYPGLDEIAEEFFEIGSRSRLFMNAQSIATKKVCEELDALLWQVEITPKDNLFWILTEKGSKEKTK